MEFNGILGFIILLLDIFAIIKLAKSSETTGMKVLWILIVVLLPVIGLIAWFVSGPGDKSFKL